jgi:hypothetical protein
LHQSCNVIEKYRVQEGEKPYKCYV